MMANLVAKTKLSCCSFQHCSNTVSIENYPPPPLYSGIPFKRPGTVHIDILALKMIQIISDVNKMFYTGCSSSLTGRKRKADDKNKSKNLKGQDLNISQ